MRDTIKISELKELLKKRKKTQEKCLVECYKKIILQNTKDDNDFYNCLLGKIAMIENILEAIEDYESQ